MAGMKGSTKNGAILIPRWRRSCAHCGSWPRSLAASRSSSCSNTYWTGERPTLILLTAVSSVSFTAALSHHHLTSLPVLRHILITPFTPLYHITISWVPVFHNLFFTPITAQNLDPARQEGTDSLRGFAHMVRQLCNPAWCFLEESNALWLPLCQSFSIVLDRVHLHLEL